MSQQSQLNSQERFEKAVKISSKINRTNVTDEEIGNVYGLYKQSLFGDCNIKCPNKITDYKGHQKWQHWNFFKGKDKDSAMNEYTDLIIDMADKYGLKEATKK